MFGKQKEDTELHLKKMELILWLRSRLPHGERKPAAKTWFPPALWLASASLLRPKSGKPR